MGLVALFWRMQESNGHNKKKKSNPKFHDWNYVESENSECQSIRKTEFPPGQNRLQGFEATERNKE